MLFIASLTQTAFQIASNDPTNREAQGFLMLIIGWTGIFEMPYGIPWLANPLLILSWIMLNQRMKTSLLLSFLAILFSASFLLYKQMPENEGGSTSEITGVGLGYWLWLSSCISFFLGALIYVLLKIPSKNNNALLNASTHQA